MVLSNRCQLLVIRRLQGSYIIEWFCVSRGLRVSLEGPKGKLTKTKDEQREARFTRSLFVSNALPMLSNVRMLSLYSHVLCVLNYIYI